MNKLRYEQAKRLEKDLANVSRLLDGGKDGEGYQDITLASVAFCGKVSAPGGSRWEKITYETDDEVVINDIREALTKYRDMLQVELNAIVNGNV